MGEHQYLVVATSRAAPSRCSTFDDRCSFLFDDTQQTKSRRWPHSCPARSAA
jgi:hypothetical protein